MFNVDSFVKLINGKIGVVENIVDDNFIVYVFEDDNISAVKAGDILDEIKNNGEVLTLGDRVKINPLFLNKCDDKINNPQNTSGTIQEIDSCWIYVKWDNKGFNFYSKGNIDLTLND